MRKIIMALTAISALSSWGTAFGYYPPSRTAHHAYYGGPHVIQGSAGSYQAVHQAGVPNVMQGAGSGVAVGMNYGAMNYGAGMGAFYGPYMPGYSAYTYPTFSNSPSSAAAPYLSPLGNPVIQIPGFNPYGAMYFGDGSGN